MLKHYVVAIDNGSVMLPTRFATKVEASAYAKQLAEDNPGRTVLVYVLVASGSAPAPAKTTATVTDAT